MDKRLLFYTISMVMAALVLLAACSRIVEKNVSATPLAGIAPSETTQGTTPIHPSATIVTPASVPTRPSPTHTPSVSDQAPSRNGRIAGAPPWLNAVQYARADLAQQLGIEPDTAKLVSLQRRTQPTDASDSAETFVGWEISLSVKERVYRYYVDTNGKVHQR